MNKDILTGNEKLIFMLEKINIRERFGTDIAKKFKAMEGNIWEYTLRPNSEMYVKYKLLKGNRLEPFVLHIIDEAKSLTLKYTLITDDSEYGDLVLTFTTRSLNEEKYKEIPLENKVIGIQLIEKIINKTYDLFVRDTVAEVLVEEIEKLI